MPRNILDQKFKITSDRDGWKTTARDPQDESLAQFMSALAREKVPGAARP